MIKRVLRTAGIALIAACLSLAPIAAPGADPYEIHVLLPLTGIQAFIGTGQSQALSAIELMVNKAGGIGGRPIKFVVGDDQSNPQIAVQLAQALITQHVPLVLGPTLGASCAAVLPLFDKSGPVQYCFSPGIHPTPGGFVFTAFPATTDNVGVPIRYFRARGWHRIAYIVSTDVTGQDAEGAINTVMALPENKDSEIVDREHFATTDISVAAQMARIRTAAPQVLIAWSAGTPVGTLFHGLADAGLDIPVLTSPGNLNYTQMKQFAQILPRQLYFAGFAFAAPEAVSDRGVKSAVTQFATALAVVGAKPDLATISSWDPTMVALGALRKLGTDATANQIRDYLASLSNWPGALGLYDFRAVPQRGVGEKAVLVVRWDPDRSTFFGVSELGGRPLPAPR